MPLINNNPTQCTIPKVSMSVPKSLVLCLLLATVAFAAEIGKNKEAEKSGAKDNKKVEPADKSKRGLDHHLGYELSHGLLGLEESHHLDDKLGHIDIKHGHIDVKHGHIDLKHSDIGYHDDGHDHGHISTITIEKHVPVPYPVKIIVEKKIPVIKEKLVPIPVKVPVHIEKKVPYPVHVPVPVKVPVHIPVVHKVVEKVPVYIKEHHYEHHDHHEHLPIFDSHDSHLSHLSHHDHYDFH